jgi:hypothetical protein
VAASSFETLVSICKIARCHSSGDCNVKSLMWKL